MESMNTSINDALVRLFHEYSSHRINALGLVVVEPEEGGIEFLHIVDFTSSVGDFRVI